MSAAILMAAVGAGCGPRDPQGSHTPEDSQSSASTSPTATGSPEPASGASAGPDDSTPSTPAAPAPAPGWWQVTPKPTPITFAVPACVPVSPPEGTRHAHPCSVKRFGTDGLPKDIQYLDAQGRDTGLFQFAQGALSTGYRLTSDAQGRPLHKDFYSGSKTTPDSSVDWHYDASGRLVLLTGDGLSLERHSSDASEGPPRLFTAAGRYQERHLYDALGRLTRIEHLDGPQSTVSWESYSYDSGGRLATITYARREDCSTGPLDSDPSCGAYVSRSFTYHPGGQLKHAHSIMQGIGGSSWDVDYDEQGHQVSGGDSLDESGSSWTRLYDARGQFVEEYDFGASSSGTSEGRVSWLYDDAGRPGARRFSGGWNSPGANPSTGHALSLTRSFRACGSGDLLFEEQDINADGVRDGSHELTRDAAGNLRTETYHGSLTQDVSLSRVEYDYSCYE